MNNAVIIYIYIYTHTFKYQYFNKEIVFEYPIKGPLSFACYIKRLLSCGFTSERAKKRDRDPRISLHLTDVEMY